MLEGSKNLTFTDTTVKILSALNDDSKAQIESMANELCKDYLARQDETANKNNLDALFNIGYGLYVVTSSDGSKDNGLIVNTVSQVTNTPNRIAVTINKAELLPPRHQADRRDERVLSGHLPPPSPFSRPSASRAAARRTNSPALRSCAPTTACGSSPGISTPS